MTTVTIAMATVFPYGRDDIAHNTFVAVGRDADHARETLMNVWHKHVQQTGTDPDLVHDDDIHVFTASPGQPFRDGRPFPRFDVTTWADGYGRWHVHIDVPNDAAFPPGMANIARNAIAGEIIDREESPGRPAARIRESVHVEQASPMVVTTVATPKDTIRFHYAETL